MAGLFGFDPTFRDPVGVPLPGRIEMPGIGSLANINVPGHHHGPSQRLQGGVPVTQLQPEVAAMVGAQRPVVSAGGPRIVALDCFDVRFPTSLAGDGSDAMNPDPDYSAAYAVLRTDVGGPRGTRCASPSGAATTSWSPRSTRCGRTWSAGRWTTSSPTSAASAPAMIGDSQLRWLGPEKGVMHMAIGAVVNAAWDLAAKVAGQAALAAARGHDARADRRPGRLPLPRGRADPAPRRWSILRAAAAGREERIAELERDGYPAYTTTPGWIGYSDEKLVAAVPAGGRRRVHPDQAEGRRGPRRRRAPHGAGPRGGRARHPHRGGREPALGRRRGDLGDRRARALGSVLGRGADQPGRDPRPRRDPRAPSRRSRSPPASTSPTG